MTDFQLSYISLYCFLYLTFECILLFLICEVGAILIKWNYECTMVTRIIETEN